MNTLAYLLLFAAAIGLNAVRKGRAANIAEDLGDAFIGAVRGDGKAIREVFNRSGASTVAPQAELPASTPGVRGESAFKPSTGGAITRAATKRGSLAKGYRWGATGPDYYDCSGLMWRACQDAGVNVGGRFTTATFSGNKAFTRVSKPAPDDIVLWPFQHIGVVTGDDTYYSAISTKRGIGSGKISAQPFKGGPQYFRATNVRADNAGVSTGASGGKGGSW